LRMRHRLKVVLFALTLLPAFAEAQSFYAIRRNRNLMIGGGSGIAYYKGDLVDPRELGVLKPNLTFNAELYFLPRFSARAGVTWFQVSGTDKTANDDRVERNLHFRTNGIEIAATGAVNLIPIGTRFYQRARINLHAFGGVGIVYYSPRAEYQGKWVALRPLETENKRYSAFSPVFPFGLGARIKLDPFFNILIEGGYRITLTDYLDDVSSTEYPDPALLKSDLARALSDRRRERDPEYNVSRRRRRGNPENDDGYFIGNVSLQYYLPTEVFRNSQRKLYNKKRRAIYKRRR
jgi:hypothetical protein